MKNLYKILVKSSHFWKKNRYLLFVKVGIFMSIKEQGTRNKERNVISFLWFQERVSFLVPLFEKGTRSHSGPQKRGTRNAFLKLWNIQLCFILYNTMKVIFVPLIPFIINNNCIQLLTPRYFRPRTSLTKKSTISIKAITINCRGEAFPKTTPKEIKTAAEAKSLNNMLKK